jgi:hypothetical protein
VTPVPDSELHGYLTRYQAGDAEAGWQFIESVKIRAIIQGRLRKLRMMYAWLPQEDFEDVECGLRPRLLEIAKGFSLPEQRNDGRIIKYFAARILGEADFLLKKITGMKQVFDEETKITYFKSLAQTLESVEGSVHVGDAVDDLVIGSLEDERQTNLLRRCLASIPPDSNDRVWLKCYILRLASRTWLQIAQETGYKQTDYSYLKDNTARFVTRLKDRLIRMGEQISYRICGIYTDDSEVAICIYDSSNSKKNLVWSKSYDSYAELDRIEAKLGDVFRQYEITYVVINDTDRESRSTVIIMRYLSKREAFVEFIPLGPFMGILPRMPDSVNGTSANQFHRKAFLLTQVKRAILDLGVLRKSGVPENTEAHS